MTMLTLSIDQFVDEFKVKWTVRRWNLFIFLLLTLLLVCPEEIPQGHSPGVCTQMEISERVSPNQSFFLQVAQAFCHCHIASALCHLVSDLLLKQQTFSFQSKRIRGEGGRRLRRGGGRERRGGGGRSWVQGHSWPGSATRTFQNSLWDIKPSLGVGRWEELNFGSEGGNCSLYQN